MTDSEADAPEQQIYQNPVYRANFADPFVLKWAGEYWAYCTGVWSDGRGFGVLRSPDLVNWQEVGGALSPLPVDAPCYWAPEVSYWNGQFYMYYSVGDEATMHLRVAVANQPQGPFRDSGRQLTDQTFAIDPHLFVDDDGSRYLFYATDFLDYTRIGTGTVCDRLLDPFQLAGRPQPVSRALYDWQIYDPRRESKGNVRWHTIEGPFVLKHKGRYYQMFSGGNWQNTSYGVSYAVSDRVERDDEWKQVADGVKVPPILQTIPNQVIGPGHNSVVRGPDNRQLYCVYHRWASDGSGRQMAIDPLDWAGERMLILGPTTTPQPIIQVQTIPGPVKSGAGWHSLQGHWAREGNELSQLTATGPARLSYDLKTPYFLLELSLRADSPQTDAERYGLKLGDGGDLLTVSFERTTPTLKVSWQTPTGPQEHNLELPADFKFAAYHLLRLEVAGDRATLSLDEAYPVWAGRLARNPARLELFTEQTPASFAGVALTPGWEDLFTESEADSDPARLGWQGAGWEVRDNALHKVSLDEKVRLTKGPRWESYELVINVGLDRAEAGGSYGIYPAYTVERPGPLLRLETTQTGWRLVSRDETGEQILSLPSGFDPFVPQQLRFRKEKGRLEVFWEQHRLGELAATEQPTTVALSATVGVSFDTVRLTAYGDF